MTANQPESEENQRVVYIDLAKASAIAHCLALFGASYIPRRSTATAEVRPCVQCGKMKSHNNAYCSPECCKAHRKKGKAIPENPKQ